MRQLLMALLLLNGLLSINVQVNGLTFHDQSLKDKIAFTEFEPNLPEIRIETMDPDGSNAKVIYTIEKSKEDKYPFGTRFDCNCDFAWSPDHQNLRYTLFYPSYPFRTYIIRGDGSSGDNFYNSDYFSFKWSPDGHHLAYLYRKDRRPLDSNFELYIADGDGSNPKRFTDKEVSDFAWGADSKRIALSSSGTIYTGSLDEKVTLKRLISNELQVNGLTWSPDGKYILYLDRLSLYWLNVETGLRRKVVSNTGTNFYAYYCYHGCWDNQYYRWSPDGSTLLLNSKYLISADGINQRPLPMPTEFVNEVTLHLGYNSGRGAMALSWSPDSRHILYSKSGGNIPGFFYVWDLTSSPPILIPETNNLYGYGLNEGVWSPNSSQIAYLLDQQICTRDLTGTNRHCITPKVEYGSLSKLAWVGASAD